MNMHRNPIAMAIATILSCSLLTACGGGGGGVVRSSPPPQSPPPTGNPPAPPPPPPPAAPASPCPAPVTGDCVVLGTAQSLTGGRQSDYGLKVGNETTAGHLQLWQGDRSRFGAGTVVVNGRLSLEGRNRDGSNPGTVLGPLFESNITVGALGTFEIIGGARSEAGLLKGNVDNLGAFGLYGTADGNLDNRGTAVIAGSLRGSVTNHGRMSLSGVVAGDIINQGRMDVGSWANGRSLNRVDGNFQQAAAGVLGILLPTEGEWSDSYTYTLFVGGHAALAGVLELQRPVFNDYGAWYGYLSARLPIAPLSFQVLHADGGVSGRFDAWRAADWLDEKDTPQPLFIQGSLRYGSNDVWFDLTRISLQAAMAGQGVGGITLASAGNLDRAFAIADGFATAPDASQSRFLRSAGRLLWLGDAQQAARSLDSLSGSVHADALHRAGQGNAMSSALGQRLLTLQPGQVSGSWSQTGVDGTVAGFDQRLGSRLVLGASTSLGNNTEAAGQARDHERQAALYLRWFGDEGWYAGGSAGFAHHALTTNRPIDLGAGGRWNAHSQRTISVASMETEAGRRYSLGGGVLAPYASLGAQAIRSERALEQGSTGLELALQATTQARLSAGVGLRYGRRWQFGEGGWLQLDADARMQHALAQAGSPLHAAFIGVPDVRFALPGSFGNTAGWLSLGVRGGTATGWGWSLGHAGSFGGTGPERQWALGLQRRF